jgi:hypothetical protein
MNMLRRIKNTCSGSILDSISNICLDSVPLILPHIILAQTNTIKVALIPKPIAVVIKFIVAPNISQLHHLSKFLTSGTQFLKTKKHQVQHQILKNFQSKFENLPLKFSKKIFKEKTARNNINKESNNDPRSGFFKKWQQLNNPMPKWKNKPK